MCSLMQGSSDAPVGRICFPEAAQLEEDAGYRLPHAQLVDNRLLPLISKELYQSMMPRIQYVS